MKQWTREAEIDAPIEKVWQFFDGSLENMQKIMPQVGFTLANMFDVTARYELTRLDS